MPARINLSRMMRTAGPRSWHRRIRPAFLAFILPFTSLGSLRAESEGAIKAAYLANFAKLVEWPASALAGEKALIIGVVGRDAVADEVARTLAGANVGGRRIEVRRLAAVDAGALLGCHVIFVSDSERGEAIIGAVRGRPVLVVGEAENFARRGGALGFVSEGGNVKFEANAKAAALNGLTVSSRLLRVAREVIDK